MSFVVAAGAGALVTTALQELDLRGYRPDALVVHGATATSSFSVLPQTDSVELARTLGIAVHVVHDSATLQHTLGVLRPDVLLSVCYPRRFTPEALAFVGSCALNLHSSRLPAWRGPDPVFWQLRYGRSAIGYCIHHMTVAFDAGTSVVSGDIALDNIATEVELESRLAGKAIEGLVAWHAAGAGVVERSLNVAKGRWWRSPVAGDYRMFPTWTCAHAKRFMRLLHARGHPFQMIVNGEHRLFERTAGDTEHGSVSLAFSDGNIRCIPITQPSERR